MTIMYGSVPCWSELLERQESERAGLVQQAMMAEEWNLSAAARRLGISQPHLYGLLQNAKKGSPFYQIWRDYRKTKPKRGKRA